MRAMPRVLGTLLLAVGFLPVIALDTASEKKVYYYSSDQVKKSFGVDPNSKVDSTNGDLGELLKSTVIPKFKGASIYSVTVRRKDHKQDPEFHTKKTHIFYVMEGNATMVTGGKTSGKGVGDERVTKFRGQTVEGGQTWNLDKGSIIVVPAGVIHWFKDVPSKPWVAFNVELFQ